MHIKTEMNIWFAGIHCFHVPTNGPCSLGEPMPQTSQQHGNCPLGTCSNVFTFGLHTCLNLCSLYQEAEGGSSTFQLQRLCFLSVSFVKTHCYRPPAKFGEGNVLTRECHYVIMSLFKIDQFD